jgi:hypothetical protein
VAGPRARKTFATKSPTRKAQFSFWGILRF